MKKILLILFTSLFGIIFSAWLFRTIYNKIELKKEKAVIYIIPDEEKKIIQNGDIILRYGHGFVSDYIVNTFNEEFSISHCGIISKQGNELNVIHSESSSFLSEEGIQIQDFDEFVDAGHKHSAIVVRFNRCLPNELPRITNRANYYLKKKIPFDYGFNHKDTTVMFCSEIIWHVFLDEFDIDIFSDNEGNTNFSQFQNFWDSAKFDIILNHQAQYSPEF